MPMISVLAHSYLLLKGCPTRCSLWQWILAKGLSSPSRCSKNLASCLLSFQTESMGLGCKSMTRVRMEDDQVCWHQPIDGAGLPSKTDFDRNFDVSSPAEEKSAFSYEGLDNDDDDDDTNYDGVEGDEEDGGPLIPGRYRALYAFEPEGTAEMALEEDQVVHVIGRGGGVGWAVVQKEDGSHALVPESYLELVEASREQ